MYMERGCVDWGERERGDDADANPDVDLKKKSKITSV